MGNCGMITGAFSSTSGKADTVLTTNGDVLYYNSGRQRLAIGSEGKVLTVSDADLPAWETASGSWVGTATSSLAMANYDITAIGETIFTAGTFTISSGNIVSTKTLCDIRTEGGAGADDLDTNSGATGKNFLIYSSNSANDVTIKTDTGTSSNNRHLNIGAADFTLDNYYDNATYCHLYADDRICMLSSADNL